jgi:hypothetical protein
MYLDKLVAVADVDKDVILYGISKTQNSRRTVVKPLMNLICYNSV